MGRLKDVRRVVTGHDENGRSIFKDDQAFETCMNDEDTRDLVFHDLQNGTDAGGRGTPFVVVLNNETGDPFPFSGALPIEHIRSVVEQALSN